MKFTLIFLIVLVVCLDVASHTTISLASKPHPLEAQYVSYGSYGSEIDWNDPHRIIPLGYRQTQGKRIFDQQCVWCHADATPAGPSNRSNVTPTPALMNDGTVLNKDGDDFLRKIIAQGGTAVRRSPMMPPYGNSLTDDDISTLIAYMRAIAAPPFKSPSTTRRDESR
jgi:cytochrome c5